MTVTLEETVASLDLPTATAVAHMLAVGGFKGKKFEPSGCPLAVYFTARTGLPVTVDTTRVCRYDEFHGWVSLPPSAVFFRRNFDNGDYPGLDIDAPAVVG